MDMKRIAGLAALVMPALAFSAFAADQAAPQSASLPVENMIVTEPRFRTERALDNFIIDHAAQTRLVGKIARWKAGICPITIGLADKFDTYITQRIIKVAMAAGAPLSKDEPCRPNVLVLATPQAQKLMDFVRAKRPALLGFHYRSQAQDIATMRRPVQAWYSTATEDFDGFITADLPSGDLGYGVMSSQGQVPRLRVSGSRSGNGLKSEFTAAIVVIDTTKIAGQEIGPIADYIAMLALSQGQYYDTCQNVPTITNLTAGACGPEMKPDAMTDVDLTYLRGLYKMAPDGNYLGERASIAYEMKKDLGGY
ncbi:MAG TPA: hypothetical protein VHC39_11070 [Rhizomicrobium sp.]|nr:hypothetical protein [Rhizomicrobium sp.]